MTLRDAEAQRRRVEQQKHRQECTHFLAVPLRLRASASNQILCARLARLPSHGIALALLVAAWLLAAPGSPVQAQPAADPPAGAATLHLPTLGRKALPPLFVDVQAGSAVAQPALSPDNRTVAFVGTQEGGSDLFILPITGTVATKVTASPAMPKETPVFAPDGTFIVFAANAGTDWDIFAVDPDGQNLRALVAHAGSDERHPAFGGDGAQLYFSSNRAGGNWDIYAAPVAGGDWQRLTTAPAIERFPAVSWQQNFLVFRREEQGVSNLWRMHADGTGAQQVTQGATFASYPAASSAHGGVVYLGSDATGHHLWQANLGGGGQGQLSPEIGWQAEAPRFSYDGRWLVSVAMVEGERRITLRPFVAPLQEVGHYGYDLGLGECDWEAGVLAWGWVRAWERTGDRRFFEWTKQWVDGCLAANHAIAHVNDVPLAYAALALYRVEPAQQYMELALAAGDFLFQQAPRTADGTLIHLEQMVWPDTLMGVIPFLAAMGAATGEDRYLQEAVDQLLRHAAHLQDPATGLFHHGWSEPAAAVVGPSFWARGNGWVLATMAELLRALPGDDLRRPLLLERFQQLAAGLVAVQDSSGRWHTVVTRPEYYLESSGSALIAAGLAEGVRAGWLDAALAPAAESSRLGVWGQVAAGGSVGDVSGPTGPMADEAAYNGIATGSDYKYGQGAILILGATEY